MSKIKLSFSFLLSLLLVGMFSAVVFAAGSTVPGYNPEVTQEGQTIKSGLVTDDKGNDNNYNSIDKSNANKTGTNVGGTTNQFSNVIKSDEMVKDNNGTHGTQRTHGSYMNNTNSCASCHQTHTGASKNLLFKNGEYETCTACHDGTLGFYNVFTGSNSAGTFGGTHDGNMSVHLANGSVELKAAPGGNHDATSGNWTEEFTCASCHSPHGSYSDRLLNTNPNDMGNLTASNGGKRVEGVSVVDTLSGQTADYVVLRTTLAQDASATYPNATVGPLYLAKELKAGDVVLHLYQKSGTSYLPTSDPWLHGYEFDESHTKHYWTAFQDSLLNKEPIDTDLLKKGEVLGNGFAAFKNPTGSSVSIKVGTTTTTKTIKEWAGLLVTGNISRGYVVKLDVSAPNENNVTTTNVASLWASKNADGTTNTAYVANRGVAMSGFCAACHTDYLASSGSSTGTFDHAYRHTTTSDSYTCVRCHYAHGTDVTVMRDARGKTFDDIKADTTNYFPSVTDPTAREAVVKDYLMDKNPSSALKRYTNMAVCWGCHTSSHSEGTRNTDTYQYTPTPGVDTDRNGIEFDY
ncbi:cytochrome c3 family protein [Neobacillus vireti]|uniref:cytochrome c3 family protein n=1 Tax=Neobacillus vireti TaxID=220686 RepID=UPI002FFF90A2